MNIYLHKYKLPSYKKTLNLYRLTSSAKTYVHRYCVDDTMYNYLTTNNFYPQDNFFIFLFWRNCFWVLSFFSLTVVTCSFQKMPLYFLYMNYILHPAFWPFSPFNVSNSETDELLEHSIPNSLRMKSADTWTGFYRNLFLADLYMTFEILASDLPQAWTPWL